MQDIFQPCLSNLMMMGDLNFQLKLVWVESEAWLTRFVHLEFNRVFRDRIDAHNYKLLELYGNAIPEEMRTDDES